MDNTPQKQILHYTLVEKLGEGRTGSVYQAWDNNMERIIAMRFIPDELLENRTFHDQCLSTLKALVGLTHLNIGCVYDVFTIEDRLVETMEYISGQTLRERIRKGPTDNETFLMLAIQIARGLNYAHSQHITHGNIRTSNIIMTEEGVVKLVDFGLSCHVIEDEDSSPIIYDEIRFRSPEHVTGNEITSFSDLFSLGAVFWELVTGKPAFNGDSQHAVEEAILHEQLDFDKLYTDNKLPGDMVLLLEKLLAKDPKERFRDSAQLLVTLEAIQLFEKESRTREFFQVTPSTPRQYLMLSILTALLIIFWLVITTVYK